MPQICGVAKKSEHFKFWCFLTGNMLKPSYKEYCIFYKEERKRNIIKNVMVIL